jgi:hypothetical protein
MMAAFIVVAIPAAVTGRRYCAHSVAIGVPSRSVTVVVSGGSAAASWAEMASTESLT